MGRVSRERHRAAHPRLYRGQVPAAVEKTRDGLPKNSFCMACYDGNYPVPYDPLLDKHIIERRRKQTQTLGEAAARENEQINLLQV